MKKPTYEELEKRVRFLERKIDRLMESEARCKLAEAELKDTLQMSKDLLEHIPSGLYIYTFVKPDKLYLVYGNRAAEVLTGVKFEDWKGTEFDEIWSEARDLGLTDIHLEVARTGIAHEMENVHYKDDKLNAVFKIRIFPLPNNRLAVAFEDVTAQKKAQDALQDSEEKYRLMVKLTGLIVYDYNILTGQIKWSGAISEVTGFTEHYFENAELSQNIKRIHEDDRKRVVALLKKAVENGSTYKAEYRFERKNGTFVHIEDTGGVLKDKEGKAHRMLGNMRDISEQIKAEGNLRKHQLFFKHCPSGIIYYTSKGIVTKVNDSLLRMYKTTRDEIIGMSLFRIPNRRYVDAAMQSLNGEIGHFRGNYTSFTGGKTVFVHATWWPIMENGKVVSGVAIIVDLTHQKQLEAELQQSQKMETLGTFAGGIAREFNNILQIISGNSENMKLDATPEDLKRIERNLKQTERGADLVKQLMTLSSKTESLKAISLNGNAQNAKRLLEKKISSCHEIRLCLAKELQNINADRSQIEQLILNLCMNAAEAMPTGGIIQIQTKKYITDGSYSEEYGELPAGEYCVLLVSDSGYGMNNKTREQAFNLFFTTKDFGSHSGLGLAVVYGIVKGHNGHIFCFSEVGKGTKFEVFFPALVAGQ